MSRPRQYDEPRVNTVVRIPKPLHDALKAAADERMVSVNLLVCHLVEDGLRRLIPVADLTATRPDAGAGG